MDSDYLRLSRRVKELETALSAATQSISTLQTKVPGVVSQYAGTSAPDGWLLCDGSAVSRTAYPALFAIIGTTYGSGDGNTTFNLPNLQGKVPVGKKSSDTDFDVLGETGGNKTNEHCHYTNIGNDGSSVIHVTANSVMPSARVINSLAAAIGASSNTIDHWEASTYNETINILQPYIVLNYIIKY